jgi:hypothetical protein
MVGGPSTGRLILSLPAIRDTLWHLKFIKHSDRVVGRVCNQEGCHVVKNVNGGLPSKDALTDPWLVPRNRRVFRGRVGIVFFVHPDIAAFLAAVVVNPGFLANCL